ncbi:MFS transporter [Spirillospora sp. NPDC050679]
MRLRASAEFGKLWTASAVSNLGDGVTLVAGPLLVASYTGDPALIAGAAFAQQLPWPLFALVSGAYVDRLDRRRLIVAVDLLRGLALAALTAAVATGTASIPLIYATLFLLGTGETVADTAMAARLPAIVPEKDLPAANARLMATFVLGNQLAAKPLGAYLFVAGAAIPFGFDAATFLIAALLAAWMRPVPPPPPPVEGRTLRDDITEGVRHLWGDRLLRTLASTIGAANVVFCGAFAVLVLYARERLGLSEVGYGYLLVAYAVGGLLGTAAVGPLRRAVPTPALLRAGLVIETSTHAALALSTGPWTAGAALVALGAHAMVWGAVAMSLVQTRVPDRLLGRVGSVYSLIQVTGAAAGSLLGGLFARGLGTAAPFWIGAAVMTVVTAAAWRPLASRDDLAAGA